jgi:Flp pilus assembly pilin Flp
MPLGKSRLKRFWSEEDAQDLVEYSLLLGFIALAAVAILNGLSGTVKSVWGTLNTDLSSAAS